MKFTPLSSETVTFGGPFFALGLLGGPGGLLAPNMVPLKMDGFIICFLHFGIKMGLSLRFRASDVRRLIAGAANPSSSTAIGPLGAHLDPR